MFTCPRMSVGYAGVLPAYRTTLLGIRPVPTLMLRIQRGTSQADLLNRRLKISAKVEAFERFINLNAIGLGLLQVLSLEMPQTIWQHFPLWFRSLPKHGYQA